MRSMLLAIVAVGGVAAAAPGGESEAPTANATLEVGPGPAEAATPEAAASESGMPESAGPADATPPADAATTPTIPPDPHASRRLGARRGSDDAPRGEGEVAAGAVPAFLPGVGEAVRVASALTVVIGLLLGMRFLMRRAAGPLAGGARPSGVLEILARYPVSRGQSLVVLRLARRVILVHQGGASMTTLAELTEPGEVADLMSRLEAGSRGIDTLRFRRTLESFGQAHDRADAAPGDALRRADGDIEIVDLTRRPRRGATRRGRAGATS